MDYVKQTVIFGKHSQPIWILLCTEGPFHSVQATDKINWDDIPTDKIKWDY